jgi:hypothetical protein
MLLKFIEQAYKPHYRVPPIAYYDTVRAIFKRVEEIGTPWHLEPTNDRMTKEGTPARHGHTVCAWYTIPLWGVNKNCQSLLMKNTRTSESINTGTINATRVSQI